MLTAVVVAVAAGTRLAHPHGSAVPQVAAYLALGGAMFTALLLQAFGSRAVPLITALWRWPPRSCSAASGCSAQIVACTELLIVLAGYAALVLGRAVRHAC